MRSTLPSRSPRGIPVSGNSGRSSKTLMVRSIFLFNPELKPCSHFCIFCCISKCLGTFWFVRYLSKGVCSMKNETKNKTICSSIGNIFNIKCKIWIEHWQQVKQNKNNMCVSKKEQPCRKPTTFGYFTCHVYILLQDARIFKIQINIDIGFIPKCFRIILDNL